MQFDFIVNKVFSLYLDQHKESQTPIKQDIRMCMPNLEIWIALLPSKKQPNSGKLSIGLKLGIWLCTLLDEAHGRLDVSLG